MQPETCGSHVLVKVVAKTSVGEIFKALPLDGPAEIRLVQRLPEEVAKTPEAEKLVRRLAKQWQGVKDLHTLNLLEQGKANEPLWFACEYQQGRLVSDILERSRQEGIPLAVDQSVYLAERLAGALVSISTQGLSHGCMAPERMLVTFEGEVKILPGVLRDLQTTPLVAGPLLDTLRKYTPPAASQGKGPKGYADIYAVGAMLFEFLAHEPFYNGKPDFDPAARLEEARKGDGSTEVLPANLYTILKKSLVAGGEDAYQDLSAMKSDLDQLITSGEYSPTTFNIAFLMHSLFRGEDETETAGDKELLTLNRAPYRPAPPPPVAKVAPPGGRAASGPFPAPAAETPSTFGVEPEPSKKGLFIGIGVAAAVIVIGVLGFLVLRPKGPSQAELQAQEELKKLQAQQVEMAQRMKSLEDEKNSLAQQVAGAKTEEEKKKAQKALEEANKKLEASKADAARLAASTAAVATGTKPPTPPPVTTPPPTSPPTTTPSTPPPTTPSAPPTTTPSTPPPATTTPNPPEPAAPAETAKVKAGDFVELWAVEMKPKQQGDMKVQVTPAGRQNRVAGTIYVEVAVDETGKVTDARVVRGLNPDYGMNEVCREAALKLKYSPAIKEGVPVKTKVTFPIVIK